MASKAQAMLEAELNEINDVPKDTTDEDEDEGNEATIAAAQG